MPTSTLRFAGLPDHGMVEWVTQRSYRPDNMIISTLSWQAIGDDLASLGATNFADATWIGANTAYAYPFELTDSYLVKKLWWANGSDATGPHIDCGLYTEAGALIVSAGDVTQATASRLQEVDIADTFLNAGRYWAALASNATTGGMLSCGAAVGLLRSAGCAQMASAFVLPGTFVPAAITSAFMPLFGLSGRTQVA